MIHFTINEKNYSAIEQWNEMTIAKGIEFSALCRTAPQKLQDYYSIITSPGEKEEKEKEVALWSEAIDANELIKGFPEFYGQVISMLSNCPEEDMRFVNTGSRVAVYKQFFESFVVGILHEPFDYKAKGILTFDYKGVTYHLPATRNILGNERPMADRTAIEFTESADLQLASRQMAAGKFFYCANIVAILCRPMQQMSMAQITGGKEKLDATEDVDLIKKLKKYKPEDWQILEPYNEKTCLERAELFRELTMDIVFEVFFCLAQQILLFNQRMAISSLEEILEQQNEQQKPADSNSMVGTHGSSHLQVV